MPNLTIRCGFPESPEGPSGAGIPSELLVFDFGAVNDDLAVCTFCFTLGEVSVTLPESFTGWDLYEFAKQLQLFHGTLQGSIEFQNWSLSMSIVFTVVNPARGTIKIGVTIEPHFSEFSHEDRGVAFSVDGLVMDQSWLPDLVRQIHAVIRDTGVVVRDPWSEHTSQ